MSRRIYTEEVQQKVIELHTREKLGLKAISKWFNGKPGRTTIERILREAGVYQGPQRMLEQHKQRADRQQRVIEQEKQWRHRMAVCLWNLRNGVGIETSCHQNGWKPTSVWNHIRERKAYHQLRCRLDNQVISERFIQRECGWVSSAFPREGKFCDEIALRLEQIGIPYLREAQVGGTRYRADFVIKETVIEAKVDTTHNQMKKCIGQCWLYLHFGFKNILVVIPDDVRLDSTIEDALKRMGVQIVRLERFSITLIKPRQANKKAISPLHPR